MLMFKYNNGNTVLDYAGKRDQVRLDDIFSEIVNVVNVCSSQIIEQGVFVRGLIDEKIDV